MSAAKWECQLCTFLNCLTLKQCDVCGNNKQAGTTHCIDEDLEFAKRLQAEYDKEVSTLSNSSVTPNTQESSESITPLHTNSNSSTSQPKSINSISSSIKSTLRLSKRKFSEMEPDSDSDNDSYCDIILEDRNSSTSKFKMKEMKVDFNWQEQGIIFKVGSDWNPGYRWVSYTNPVVTRKMDAFVGEHAFVADDKHISTLFDRGDTGIEIHSRSSDFPYFVLDFKNIKIKVDCYVFEHPLFYAMEFVENRHRSVLRGNNGAIRGWILEASNDMKTWIKIHGSWSFDFGTDGYSSKNMRCKRDKHWSLASASFYTKFRFRMTQPNSDGQKMMKLSSFQLFGIVRRRVENIRRTNEHKEISKFPKCTNKCVGDIENVFKILNECTQLQHNECGEYNETIAGLNIELKDYQKKGVQWMLNKESEANGIHGGMICDEMGLGKTVQMIALMLIQKERAKSQGKRDRTLIITPLSLIDQWISEISKIAKPESFKYINYYGAHRKRLKRSDFESCDIVFSTTPTFAISIGKIKQVYDHFNDGWWSQVFGQELIFKLPHNFFTRIVIDESHEIKNTTSKTSASICTFAERVHAKWCLTGTPIKNDVAFDLSGMIRFLGISHHDFMTSLQLTQTEKEEKLQLPKKMNKLKRRTFWLDLNSEFCQKKLKDYLVKIMIRRTKKQVLSVGFVEKQDIVIKCKLNEEEQAIYDKNANEAKEQYQKFKKEKSVMRNYLYLIRMLTKLRQMCDHPSLVFNTRIFTENDEENNCNRNVMDLESNIDILTRVEEAIVNRINEMESLLEYECPICFELTELNGIILSKCGHMFCRECINEIDPESTQKVCPLCRGIFSQRNILRITHILKSKQLDERHVTEYEEYKENDHSKEDTNTRLYVNYEEFIEKYSDRQCMSSKIQILIERLKYIQENHANDKVLVFSNFTVFFQIISAQLNKENISHLQFHGSMNRKQRKKILDQFKTLSDCNVLLISAKCASVGLNLMCANHVIFLDPRCNPGLDNQAIGRVWRIGQTKKVYVTRLILENTVEETILELQQNKEETQESNLVNLKQKAKLNENDYDIIFKYQEQNDSDHV